MRRRVSWLLVVVGCLSLGLSQVNAAGYTWDDGDTVSGVYWADNTNTMTIRGDITVDGDVTIANTQGSTGSCHYLPIYVTADSFIHPAHNTSDGFGHLIFYNGNRSSGMFVYIDNDLLFTGSNYGDKHTNNRELTLTFSGPGQTVFHLANQKQVGFEGFFGDGTENGWTSYWDDYTKTGSGVMAYVTMDQMYQEAVVDGVNKVVFERYYAYDDTLSDPTTSSTTDSVKISIGKNSFMTYISDVTDGLLDCNDTGSGYGSIAFDPMCYGPGRMLLHMKGSNYVNSSGTLVGLTNAYNDAAFVVAGHKVSDYKTASGIRTGVSLNRPAGVEAIFRVIDEQAWRNTTYYQFLAGQRLYIDGTTSEPVLNGGDYGGQASRRGLMVFNENKSIPALAADTFRNNDWYNDYIFSTQNRGSTSIQPGFIVGINGNVELFHNTFLDYIAGSTMRECLYWRDSNGASLATASFPYTTTQAKLHNPSALTVDGLGIINLANFDPNDPYDSTRVLYPFVADAASYGGRHAHVNLIGDSRIFMRSGVRSDGYVSTGDTSLEGSGGLGGYLFGVDRLYSFTINYASDEGAYDGSFITGSATNGGLYYETVREGNNALDVEGKLTIRSVPDTNRVNEHGFLTTQVNGELAPGGCFARHAPINDPVYGYARGMINVPSIKLDFMGQEVRDDLLNRAIRPLTVTSVKYPCYNSSSIFMNDEIAMHNINWHHNDMLKVATPEQDKSEPAVLGGEKAVYYNNLFSQVGTGTANTLFVKNPLENIKENVPLLSLFDSKLECHESIVLSGLRLVVTDKFSYNLTDIHATLEPNTSTIMCYNHGDPLDMLKRGYSRTIMFGTQQNKMADAETVSDYLQNAYVNVYRGWNTDGDSTIWGDGNYLLRLSLESDIQPKLIGQYASRANSPTTFSQLVESGLGQYKRVGTQVLYLGNGSYSSLGWTTTYADQILTLDDMRNRVFGSTYSYTFGINEGHRPRPWDAAWSQSRTTLAGPSAALSDYLYSLTSEANDAGELYLNGDNFYFGGRDETGNVATEPIVASNESVVWYTNHGGRTHINQDTLSPDQEQFYDSFVDTVFAYRPWPRIWSANDSAYIDGLSGIVDLPHDQVKFGRSIQPYSLDFPTMLQANDGQTKERNVRLSVYDEKVHGVDPTKRHKASGEEITIAWNFRTDKSVKIGSMDTSPTFTPVKSLYFNDGEDDGTVGSRDLSQQLRIPDFSRSTTGASFVGASTMPEAVLTVSTGDVIQQMRISGATKADPFHLYVTGGHTGYGTVREFTSLASNYFNPGEGAHAAIMLDGGAHVGLGSKTWNEHSKDAWTILGSDYVTLYPNGNGVVEVNSNLWVADKLPIMPTTNFGSHSNLTQVLTYSLQDQRLTFYSETPREIRIPEGGELDLSAFGNVSTSSASSAYPQQIEIAGKVRLVFEAGSKLRFPSNPNYEPVLYLNDEAEIIFEGTEDRDESRWTDYTGGDEVRSKILGVGQIWLNKKSRMKINDTALLGIETDDATLTTSITISIQRQSQLLIGDENVAGGAIQVGNPVDRSGSSIDFVVQLTGAEAECRISREGFLGLGVGTINKASMPNDDGWRFNGLYNVNRVYLNVVKGIFSHRQIFDGTTRLSSVLGIGPATTFLVSLGTAPDAIVRGGGNLLRLTTAGEIYPVAIPPHGVSVIGSTADVVGDTTGHYTIMGSTPSIRQIAAVVNGTATITQGSEFSGNAQGFYNYVGFQPFSLLPASYACYGAPGRDERIGYIVGSTINRTSTFAIADGTNPESSLHIGALGATIDLNNNLVSLTRGY